MQKSIFLTGLLSARVGGLEVGNLGNFAIIDPFLDNLKIEFPDHAIRTSFQLTEPYEESKTIFCLRDERFWNYGKYTAKETFKDFFRIVKYKLSGNKEVLNQSKLLSEIFNSDFVIDFSGDVFGENAKFNVFLEGAAKFYFALLLKKKVFVLASSPGPFTTRYKRSIVKFLYSKATAIYNREPLSTQLLHNIGLKKALTAACPSYLFKGNPISTAEPLIESLGLKGSKIIGFILTGWNMPKGPYNAIPRDNDELILFRDYLIHIYETYDCKVLLMSHANKTDEVGQMDFGNDYYLLKQLYEMLPYHMHDRIILLKSILDARTSKALIGNFEVLISGRLHGAIAGISQCIPTLIFDYGHEPRAHKIKGFLELLGYDHFLCAPNDINQMISLTQELWDNKDQISNELETKVAKVKEKALINFNIVKEYL